MFSAATSGIALGEVEDRLNSVVERLVAFGKITFGQNCFIAGISSE
jgi:hypothetical protein